METRDGDGNGNTGRQNWDRTITILTVHVQRDLRSEFRTVTSFAPGGERALEPILIVTLMYNAALTHAKLVRRTDGRQAVDSHA